MPVLNFYRLKQKLKFYGFNLDTFFTVRKEMKQYEKDFKTIKKHTDKIIITNNTFSWWAAYLNKKVTEVYAPECFVGFKVKKEFPVKIIPNSFIKTPIY